MTAHRAFNVAWLAVSAKHAPAVTAAVKTVFAHTDPADVAAPRARVKCSGTAVGDSESYEFWREFLASLRARGLAGVHLVICNAHAGLKAAVAQQFTDSSWQRCRVHFMRNRHTAGYHGAKAW